MRKLEKHISLLVVGALTLVVALFAGCSGGSKEKPIRVLKVWDTELDPGAIQVFHEIARSFEQANPDVRIEDEHIAWGDIAKKLTASLSAGDPPDATHLEPYQVASFYSKGLLVPLDDVIEAIGTNDIYSSVQDLQKFDGHRYGIAYAIGTTYYGYRADWAQAKGLQTPRTWQDYLNFVKDLTETNNTGNVVHYGVDLPGGAPFFMDQLTGELVACNGGRLFDTNGRPTFTEKPVIEALEFWRELVKYAPPDWTSEGYLDQFRSLAGGRVATVPVTYARASKQIDKDAPVGKNDPAHFAVMEQPVGPSGKQSVTTIDCEPWTILKSSRVPEDAKKFLVFFYQPTNYLRYCSQVPIHLTPIRPSVAESAAYLESSFIKKWKPWQELSLSMIKEKRVRPILMAQPQDKDMPFLMELQGARILTDMVLAVTKEGKTPEAAASDAQAKAEAFITQMGYKKW